uniref:Uncharacterized protein n=1 Tax=Meloidogyne enterolobii TaxID=390850 RepID=A0A6V7TS08_MELEN|nr:unnamed protein product [Meloidogyne enterolobii]
MPLEGREGGGIYQSRWSNRLNFQTKFHLNTPPQHFNKYKHRRSLPPLNSSTKEFSFENSKNLIKQKQQPISLFVTEFIGKFTDFIVNPLNNYDEAVLYFEKILKEFNIPTNQKQTFCLLSAFEDHLQIFPFIFDELNINQNINTPINLNKEQIITISRSQTEQKMFGILTTSNKNRENIFECFLFKTLPENLQKHSEHLKISELLNIKCRKESSSFNNKNLSKLTTTTTFNCLEFTSNCSRIIANIRFLSFENSSSSNSSSSPTKEKIKNKIVYKFLKSIGLVNSLEIERELNNDFDDSDENCQNTSTESIANSGDLCDPEEIFEGNCSFEERGVS